MAKNQQKVLFTTVLFLCAWGSAVAQGLPPATLVGTGQQVCNYQYAIPNGGNCVTYGPALEQKLSAVQRDVDRTKLQFVSQNTVLMEEIRKLRQQGAARDAGIADLSKNMKNLQASLLSLQSAVAKGNNGNNGNGNNNAVNTGNIRLQQMVSTTRQQLTQDLLKLENKINSAVGVVQRDRQQDAIQQSKVDGAFQAQLRQQQQDITTILQSITQIQSSVSTLQRATQGPQPVTYPPPTTPMPTTATSTTSTTSTTTTTTTKAPTSAPSTTPAGPTTPNPLLVQLLTEVQGLKNRTQKLEQDYQTDVPALKKNMSHLLDLSKNQTLELSNVKTEADYIQQTEIPQINQELQTAHGEIAQLFRNVNQDLKPLQQQVQKVAANVTSLTSQITRLGTDTLTQKMSLGQDEIKLTDLGLQVRLLATKLTSLQNSVGVTTKSPPTTTTTGFAVPTPRPANG